MTLRASEKSVHGRREADILMKMRAFIKGAGMLRDMCLWEVVQSDTMSTERKQGGDRDRLELEGEQPIPSLLGSH
jgi:hypothetical protein